MPRISTVLALLLVSLIVPLAEARAHERLVSSSPSAGDTLTAAPAELRLTFSSRVQLAFSGLELLGPDGRQIPLGVLRSPADSTKVLVAAVTETLAPGSYTVEWRTGGADGHPVRGRFEFVVAGSAVQRTAGAEFDSVASGAAAAVAGADAEQAHEGHADDALSATGEAETTTESPLQVAVRWVTFVALLGVIGVAAFHWLILGAIAAESSPALVVGAARRARSLGLLFASLLLAAVLARLGAQWAALGGSAAGVSMSRVLATTEWGWAWLLQLAGTLLAFAGLLLAARSRGGWKLVLAAALVLGVSPALSGHAAATGSLAPLTIAADAAHVLGAGAWVGSLLVLVLTGLPAALALPSGERGPAAARLVNRFSPIALGAATLLLVSGVVGALVHLGSVGALLGTSYGRTLLVKLALVALVAALGAFHWRRARPSLGTEDAARHLRRTAGAELLVAALVLLVTALLVATPPPADLL